MSYRLEILNQAEWYQVTSLNGVLKNFDYHKLVYYTKIWRKLAKNH